jgi:sugar/nucleoside kinase (ribokinase family)
LPEKGETVTGAKFMQVYGGKGANQAVAAARAGGKVTFVSCVGEDAYTLRKWFRTIKKIELIPILFFRKKKEWQADMH